MEEFKKLCPPLQKVLIKHLAKKDNKTEEAAEARLHEKINSVSIKEALNLPDSHPLTAAWMAYIKGKGSADTVNALYWQYCTSTKESESSPALSITHNGKPYNYVASTAKYHLYATLYTQIRMKHGAISQFLVINK